MTYLWGGMILVGILYGAFAGNLQEVTEAVIASSGEAVSLCISMAGITAMWTGIMKIAENTGMVAGVADKMRPLLRFLFPRLKPDSRAGKFICMNFLSNCLGLSWASTSSGLIAIQELEKLEEQRRQKGKGKKKGTASNEMCTFLIINVSSLQLIPVSMIAYRTQYGSVNPAAIVGPAVLATAVSTGTAVIFCRIADRRGRRS